MPREDHVCTLMTLVQNITHTRNRGLVLASKELWSTKYRFKIHGESDSDYATNPDDCRSISGGRVFVNVTSISFHSITQRFVTLSATEAEIVTGIMVAQDMLYTYNLME